jgi:beta-1,4-mannosyl-glycoprotein beta-1,4-N-acetylglucosaminyltransferase
MKIYDCFMFFDKEMLTDLRLNILNEYVDKFIITENRLAHSENIKIR